MSVVQVTLELRKCQQEAYWVYMAKDVEEHCRQCVKCNQSKPPTPVRAPMTSVPIGKPWQMIAIDVLEIPLSYNNNRYLLVVHRILVNINDGMLKLDDSAVSYTSPTIEHFITCSPNSSAEQRYPSQVRRPPLRYTESNT